jgi:flagellar capping protein FliD
LDYKVIKKTAKKSIKTREIYFFYKSVCAESYRALNGIRAKLNNAEEYRQREFSINTTEAKRVLRALDRVQGAAEILGAAFDLESELNEHGLHTDVVRALEMDAVPLSEYKALAADYLRLSRAFDTAQKNLEAITEAQQAAFNSDKVIIETLINWKNER